MNYTFDSETQAIRTVDKDGNSSVYTPDYYIIGLSGIKEGKHQANGLILECYEPKDALPVYQGTHRDYFAWLKGQE